MPFLSLAHLLRSQVSFPGIHIGPLDVMPHPPPPPYNKTNCSNETLCAGTFCNIQDMVHASGFAAMGLSARSGRW